jgi:hypothetical protein
MALKNQKTTAAILQHSSTSASWQIPNWAVFVAGYFPDMDAGAIGLEWSDDNSNFYPIIDPIDGADAVIVASGSDPGVTDFSDWVRFAHQDDYFRFTCASQSTAAVTIKLRFRGR